METPLVSVIVPVYNTAKRLSACLESLKNQRLESIEVILVDDGSTDDSLSICRDFAERDNRFRVLTGPNCGVCVARNRGLDVAKGEWIAFCDSDDRVHSEIYTTLLDLARRENADLTGCAFRDVGPEVTTEGIVDFPIEGEQETIRGRDAILSRVFYPLLNDSRRVHGYLFVCLFRRDMIEARRVRFRPGITMCEDEMFFLDYLLSVETLAVVRATLYDYLRFETSACTRYYRKEGDWKREWNWFIRSKEKLRIFKRGGLDRVDATTAHKLEFLMYYHEAQAICCRPKLSWWTQMCLLADVRRRFRQARVEVRDWSSRIFWVVLVVFLPAVPLLLWAKRWKDEAVRRMDHAIG